MSCPPGMRGCAATCGHRVFVEGYRQERQRMEIAGENASLGYAEELRDWLEANPMPTFKDWLVQSKRDPMPDPELNLLPDDTLRFMQFPTVTEANEASLLAIAMNSEVGVEALRVLDIPREFTNPSHALVGSTILELADRGQPHDSTAVSDLMRERHQLPVEWDPQFPMRTVDPERYGLGAWQSHALPGESAGSFASDIRADYLPRHLADITTRAASMANGALGDVAMAKAARLTMAQELVDFPMELDYAAKPVRSTSISAVPVWEPAPEQTRPARHSAALRMPQRPVLSPGGQHVLSLRGA